MGVLCFVLGRTGTGKSYSMRNFPPEKLAVINVQGKILPFRGSGKIEQTSTDDSDKIVKAIKIYSKDYKSIVVDDYQYVMSNEFMRRATERGYDKFTEIARHAWDIANEVRSLPNDVIVYVMCHTDTDADGVERLKTIGKLLDEKIYLEGMSTIVLKTVVSDGKYSFVTQNNGRDTVKSPADMFPSYAIDNDLYYVDQKIREYYGLGATLTEEELAEIDESVKHDDIPIVEEKKKRGRKKKEEVTTEASEEEKKTKRTREMFEKHRNERANAADNTTNAESNGDSESTENAEGDASGINQPKKRGRKRKSVMEDERAEVDAENAAIIAEANTVDDADEIPFEKIEEPELKEPPRRKRRAKAEETTTPDEELETAMNEPEDTETPEQPKRRRRRTN